MKKFMTLAMAVGLLAIPAASAHAAATPIELRVQGDTFTFDAAGQPVGATRDREKGNDLDPAQQREFRYSASHMVGALSGLAPADGAVVQVFGVDFAGNPIGVASPDYSAVVQGAAAKVDIKSVDGAVVNDVDDGYLAFMIDTSSGDLDSIALAGI